MNSIQIYEMSHPKNVSYFLKQLSPLLGHDEIDIYFKADRALPAACVPICGTINELRQQGKIIRCHYSEESYLSNIKFNNPFKVDQHLDSLAFPFSKIWRFTDFSEVTALVNAYLDEMSSSVECSAGLIEGMEWSLNETMDNVLQHSLCSEGYMMGVLHKKTNYVLFSIFDNGQGIFNSLRDSEYHPRSAIDAISIAIQEGKTRDHRIGQGNGLWGLHNIVRNNRGRLEITSHGSSLILYSDGRSGKFEELPCLNSRNATTTVNFTINYRNDISVADALGGYIPSDIRFESKVDESNTMHFVLSEEASGYGTRIAGERVRNKVINCFTRLDAPSKIVIDFSGISMISSSFADEFIGKLVANLGFYRFTNTVSFVGVSPTIEMIINRSVSQRMAALFPASE